MGREWLSTLFLEIWLGISFFFPNEISKKRVDNWKWETNFSNIDLECIQVIW